MWWPKGDPGRGSGVVGPQDGAANGRCSELLRSPRSRTPSRRGRTRAIGRLSRRPPGPCLLLWPGHDRSARPDSGPCAATAERWPRNGHKAGRTGCIFSIRAVSMKMQPPRGIPGLIPFERTEKCQPTLQCFCFSRPPWSRYSLSPASSPGYPLPPGNGKPRPPCATQDAGRAPR
jgi:hypothetical protein